MSNFTKPVSATMKNELKIPQILSSLTNDVQTPIYLRREGVSIFEMLSSKNDSLQSQDCRSITWFK